MAWATSVWMSSWACPRSLADTGPLLYDTTRFARFSPDSVYYAWVGLRGNAYSFVLGARPAFVVLQYRAAAAPASVPAYPVQADWRSKWQLYAWASLSLWVTFSLALASLYAMSESRTPAARAVALLALLLFAAAAGYVDWYDYTTGDDWPIMKPLLVLGLLAGYLAEVFGVPEPGPADEALPAGPAPE